VNKDRLQESLRVHEGLSLKPYRCTAGKLTIGFGLNLDNGITAQEAYMLLDSRVEMAMKELDRCFPGWLEHDDARQNVLIEMMYNLGAPRLMLFAKMWDAMAKRDYKTAAAEMLNSKWAKQVGQRAITMSNQMRDGWKETRINA